MNVTNPLPLDDKDGILGLLIIYLYLYINFLGVSECFADTFCDTNIFGEIMYEMVCQY